MMFKRLGGYRESLYMKMIESIRKILELLLDKVLLMSEPRLIGTKPAVQRKAEQLVERMFKKGHAVMVHQGYRSKAEQNWLYQQGRTRPGRVVTNAKGGQSFHNYGVAVDIVFIVNGRPSWDNRHNWKLLGEEGKKLGFEWGGDWEFEDRPHLQLVYNYTLDDFKNGTIDWKRYG